MMRVHPQRRSARQTQKLRRKAGHWLRQLRERRGLSQRELAKLVGAEYHTFISQIEHGRGRIPPDRYLLWAGVLGVESHAFVLGLMSCYDPVTYNVIFEREPGIGVSATRAKYSSAPSLSIIRVRKR